MAFDGVISFAGKDQQHLRRWLQELLVARGIFTDTEFQIKAAMQTANRVRIDTGGRAGLQD